VTHRRSEIGILRAIGATRLQIMALFLGEGAAAGLIGSVIGVGIGILGARAITAFISTMLAQSFGVAQRADEISIGPAMIVGSIVLGVATSVIAALIPARNAARVDPVTTLQKGTYLRISPGEARVRTLAAIGLLLSAACAYLVPSRAGIYISDLLTVLAALLLVPAASIVLTRIWRPILRTLWPVEGAIAADSILRAPRRVAGAVSALMLSLALVIALGGIAQGAYAEIRNWLTAEFGADLYVSPTQSLTAREFRFPDSMLTELQAIPGVASVDAVRGVRLTIRNTPTLLLAADPGLLRRICTLSPVAGDPETMYQLAVSGKGVLAAEAFVLLRGHKLGDSLEIPAPSGILRLPIVGVVKEYTDQQGSLLISRQTFIQHWGDTTVNLFGVHLQPGAAETEVRRAIAERLKDDRRFFLLSNAEVRRFVLDLVDQWFGTTYLQIAIAVLVAALGIVNALTVSITDRRQELGVLRAVGGMGRQIRRTVWIEGVLIGAIGLTLGLLLGGIQLFYSLQTTVHDISGVSLEYLYPYELAGILFVVVLAVAFGASVGPAESVVRTPLVTALEYE